ncbi:hypothetical protein [Streptomyces reniochalinae]|uniref:Uncharacterized protein n=1 Tax=Streptomyces reniochalinae TaxID=2250578 RepID=A0A367E9U3_9ACTN|nr:hypothetical protein [Streptomyces reniochalinae]RCG14818.1 hypothetical protein DQ392_27395 [Streptomyces reniochalinae]
MTLGVVAGLIVVGAFAGSGQDDDAGSKDKAADTTSVAPAENAEKGDTKDDTKAEKADNPKPASQADQFKAHIAKNGTAPQQEASKHITSVTGADKRNDIMDAAEIHTDYSGGLTGPHSGDGKLLATAFASWKHSDNGLVTVYDASGEILSNGNY